MAKNNEGVSLGKQIGAMYQKSIYDWLIDIARGLSQDMANRPELYQKLSSNTIEQLFSLHRLGFDPLFPDKAERQRLYQRIFGTLDSVGSRNDGSPFQNARKLLFDAASGFAENAQAVGFPMHRARLRSSIIPAKKHFESIAGSALNAIEIRLDSVFSVATSLIREPEIGTVFGISSGVSSEWPLRDSNITGSKLIERITTTLPAVLQKPITSEIFIRLQEIGKYGERSLRTILDESSLESDDEVLDSLTSDLYTWGTHLAGSLPKT